MTSIYDKPLSEIGEADLQRLVDASASERMRLEFKQTFEPGDEDAKFKIAKAVVAFASVPGGESALIIIGVAEARRNGLRCASKLTPLERQGVVAAPARHSHSPERAGRQVLLPRASLGGGRRALLGGRRLLHPHAEGLATDDYRRGPAALRDDLPTA